MKLGKLGPLRFRLGSNVSCVALIIMACLWLFPVLWPITTSIRPAGELFTYPPKILPSNIELTHYRTAWYESNFQRYFVNTVIYTVGTLLPMMFISALAAYAFARLEFRGRDVLYVMVLAALMVPGQIVFLPLFLIVKHFPLFGGNDIFGSGGTGLFNTFAGMIVPQIPSAFSIFFLRQFFLSLPKDLEDSARIDGASEFRIFWQVMLPLCKPALITLSIFQFTNLWNDLLWPLVIAPDSRYRVLQVGLAIFMGEQRRVDQWNELMAASFITMIPVLVLFIVMQRHFTKTHAMAGLKG